MVGSGDPSSSPISDEDLIVACLAGQSPAWDALIDRYAALIYSIPLRYGFGEADAADIFQMVCITLLAKLATIRAPRGLAAWLITTTSRRCIATARQHQREQRRFSADGLDAAASQALDPHRLPEDELLALERHLVVRRAIEALAPPCRTLVEALFSDSSEPTSYAELADRLGISANSLGPTRARCLARLRALLDAAGFAP